MLAMATVTLEMRVACRCPGCSVLTPIPGIRRALSCRNCAQPLDFVAIAGDSRIGGVRYPFGGCYDVVVEALFLLDDGEPCNDARDSHGTPVELQRATPSCRACSTRLPLPTNGATTIACPGCSDDIPVRWPDDETREWDPRITCIIGDGKHVTPPASSSPGTEGEVVACGGCGAPLASADRSDRRRSRTCTHCGGTNTLPDAAWLALFPLPTDHSVFLVYDLDFETEYGLLALAKLLDAKSHRLAARERDLHGRYQAHQAAERAATLEALRRREAAGDRVERLALDPTLTDEEAALVDANLDDHARARIGPRCSWALVSRWVGSSSADLRTIAATHPNAPATILSALAADPDASVRAKVAGHPNAPAAVLSRLRKDRIDEVREAVRGNSSYRPGLFERVFSRG
jgi:hypothetical protein